MADLFAKPGATSFGHHQARGVALDGLSTIHENNPLSPGFNSHCKSPGDLVFFLIAMQTKRYGKAFDLPQRALSKHLTRLAEKYSVDVVARSISYGTQVSLFPFSTKFLNEYVIPEILERCRPFLTDFQEKTKE